jgi:hypothetical protein
MLDIAAITASTLLGRLSTRCWNIAAISLHSSGKAFHEMLEHFCGDFLPFSYKRISEVGL